jgi:release factor glutamine methyltransferase
LSIAFGLLSRVACKKEKRAIFVALLMTLHQAYNTIASQLREISPDLADREAEEIVSRISGCKREELFLSKSRQLTKDEEIIIKKTAAERSTGTPLAYVLRKKFFHSVDLQVTPDVLIPRPDTEILVETVLVNEKSDFCFFLDLCTGPGTIAAAILAMRAGWASVASDISLPALAVARCNLGVRSSLVCADLLTPFASKPHFDFIVCNPPYISEAGMAALDASVRDYEPRLALRGGSDGLDFYRRLAADSIGVLRRRGRLYLEIGYDQESSVRGILMKAGWKNVSFYKDLSGLPRVATAIHPDV